MDADIQQAFDKIDGKFDDVKKLFEVTWTMIEHSAEETRLELRREFRSELGAVRDELRAEFQAGLGDLGAELRGEMGTLGADLRREMGTLGAELRREIGTVRNDLRGEIGTLRGDMNAGFAQVHAELADLRSDIQIVAESVIAVESRVTALERR